MITKKYYKLIRVSHADEGYFYIKNVSNEVGEFKINMYSSGTMEYSLDGVTWTSYDLTNKPGVNVNPNSNIYLRGTNFNNTGYSQETVFIFNKDFNIGGNYMSLLNYATMNSATEIGSSGVIKKAFKNQTHLISAADLNFGNVTTISGSEAFGNFFEGCTSLSSLPDYSNITSVGQYCFFRCFYNCDSLTNGVDFSNITSVGSNGFDSCYQESFHILNVIAPNIQDLTQNNVLRNWLTSAGTQATGTKTVRVPTGATIATDSNSGIPTGWTRVDY